VFVIHVSMSYHLCMLSVYATVFPFLVIVDQ
jgi:hypothetical protein